MTDPVVLKLRQRLFVGAFAPVRVQIDPASGMAFEDLEFVVPDGLSAGVVSTARGDHFHPQRHPEVMLLAGYRPGGYVVEVVHKPTGAVVGAAKYEVTDIWEDERRGPGLWFSGSQQSRAAGSAWGGGPTGPQNVNVIPAAGTRRVAVLLVDTSSQRFPSDTTVTDAHKQRWLDEIANGVPAGALTRSTRAFYEEVSYGGFTLTAQAFGPFNLPGDFSTYFNADGSPKGSYYQACFTAGDNVVDYTQFDTVLCVSQSVTDAAGAVTSAAWPYASIGSWGPYTTWKGNLNRGVSSMPNEWGTLGDREIHETFAHELGHNLGMGDQYTPTVAGRNPGDWEMMHADDPFPHFSIAHRMMLGWVPPGWLRTFNFAAGGAPVDQQVTLTAIERGAPPAARSAGVEVRVADGLNYYFEYRNGESPQIADLNLPTDNRVLGTDVASGPYVPPLARPAILLLPSDGTDDGAVLGVGDFYSETDTTDPLFPAEFRADVTAIDGTRADLRIRYGTNGRPDPSIRPWPAGPGRQWQSPDIEVRNARNATDATWRNVPWVGQPNTVVASVRNAGNTLAPGVRVNFLVKNYNIGGAPEAFLGSDVRDVPAGVTVEFSAPWVPPSTGHFCVVVRIPLYQVPSAPSVIEMTELNNLAQSNYDRFNTSSASPSTRETTTMEVGNPYDRATRVFLVANQTNPLYRTFLEHTWLWLEPGETRHVAVMFEHAYNPDEERLPDDLAHVGEGQARETRFTPNDVGIYAVIEDPYDEPRHAKELLGGAQALVTHGRETRIERLDVDGPLVAGEVVAVDTGAGVPAGAVLVTVDRGDGPEAYEHYAATVSDGMFRVEVARVAQRVRVDYLGEVGFAPSTSEWLRLR